MTKQEQFIFNKIDELFLLAIQWTREAYPLNINHYYLGMLEGWVEAWKEAGTLNSDAYAYINRCIEVLNFELDMKNYVEERMKENVSDKEST